MKWLLLSLCVFCFFALGEVLCEAPDTIGDTWTVATDVSAKWRSTATNPSSGAVERNVHVENYVSVLTAAADDEEAPSSSAGGNSRGVR